MLKNEITKQSLRKLDGLGFEIIGSQIKELVCKDVGGDGAMADPEDIFFTQQQENF